MISKSNVKFTDSNVKFNDSEARIASRFASSNQQEIEKLLGDKDSENTKRSAKVAKELFYDKKELAQVRNIFMWKRGNAFVVIFFKTMYNQTIIRSGFCDTGNNQGPGQPSASADNTNLDLDYSGYHKNLSNNCLFFSDTFRRITRVWKITHPRNVGTLFIYYSSTIFHFLDSIY